MNCIDVLRSIISTLSLQSAQFMLFEHFVGVNWRVRYPSTSEKLKHLGEGLIQHFPCREWQFTGEEILSQTFVPNSLVFRQNYVVSLSSKITFDHRTHKHLAMMNLHPEDSLTYNDVVNLVEAVTKYMPGYLLKSGRYYHFYGVSLLEESEWIRFMAQFLMPTVIVSPRFIGHCLYRGYVALRLSTDEQYKPLLPEVCDLVGTLKESIS